MKNLRIVLIIAFSIISNLSYAQNSNKESVMIVIDQHDAAVLNEHPFTIYIIDNMGNYSITEFNATRKSRNDNVLIETKNVIDVWMKKGFQIVAYEIASIDPSMGYLKARTIIIMTN